MKKIVLDISQFIFLVGIITLTAWVWMKSLAICPKSFSDEYILLHQKYNQILQERDKFKHMIGFMQNNMNIQQQQQQHNLNFK